MANTGNNGSITQEMIELFNSTRQRAPILPNDFGTTDSRRISASTASAAHIDPFRYDSVFNTKKPFYTESTTVSSTSTPPVKVPEAELRKARSDIMLKLLEIERTRCLSKKDEEERTEGLAELLEGDDIFLARIEKGMDKYLKLMFGTSDVVPAPSLATMFSAKTVGDIQHMVFSSGIHSSLWNLRQHQFSNNKDGTVRMMVEFSTGTEKV